MTDVRAAPNAVSLLPTPAGYARQATLPLPSLVLLLPFILIYEIGAGYLTTTARAGRPEQIIAFSKLQDFFRLFGANARHMPAIAVIVMLLCWHVARKDAWRVSLQTVLAMGVESLILGLPLLGVAWIVNRYLPPLASKGGVHLSGRTLDQLIMDIGAGVYEEFVFRFVLFTLLSLLIHDLLRIKGRTALAIIVGVSAVLFSAYHYWSPNEHFLVRVFAFRVIAGLYFGVIFVFRGFGITALSHCVYDVIVTIG